MFLTKDTSGAKVYDNMATRYRPVTLDDLVGQNISIGKVEGFLYSGKVPRAILISGPFGAGKTSLARMIARYLNCQSHGPKKCCVEAGTELCYACKQMGVQPTLSDYMELNAANARGINEIREIIELSIHSPMTRFRVICCDEAHQLTPQASQALLKPLEEPSPKTVWIICTTAPEKILPTIRSRCFPIDIQHVKPADCLTFLKKIALKEEAPALPDAVYEQIAISAHGHPRTALMAFESVLAYISAKGVENIEHVVKEVIEDIIKVQPEVVVERYVKFLLNGSVHALGVVNSVNNAEQFLQLAYDLVLAITLVLAGAEHVEKYFKDFTFKTKWSREFGLKNLRELVQIQHIFMNAYTAAKAYVLDAPQLVNTATLEALTITREWSKIEKTS